MTRAPLRALITGIGGSMGCHFLAHLMRNTDWEIVGIDSFRHMGLSERVTKIMADNKPWWPRLKIVQHDLRAPISFNMSNDIGRIDYVLNLAALSDVYASINSPGYSFHANTQLMTTMLDWARLAQPRVFLHMSTDEVYGPVNPGELHSEWAPILPSNPYAASKAAQEAIAISHWRTFCLPLVMVNVANNFGEMQSPAKFPAIVQRLVTAGETVTIHGAGKNDGTRYYIHSRNTADACLYIIRNLFVPAHRDGDADWPARYNIAGDGPYSNYDMADMVAGLLGKKLDFKFEDFSVTRPGHDHHYGLDGSLLWRLGWRPPVSFMESLRATVIWQQNNPQWLHPR
jgi:dTDP-glucose 4,6-dehydratase